METTSQAFASVRNIPFKDLTILQANWSRGNFASIDKAQWRRQFVAIKRIFDPADVDAEVAIFSKIHDCRYIISFHGITTDYLSNQTCLVMEFAANGCLKDYLQKNALDWNKKVQLGSEIAQGLAFIHSEQLLHRDLHPGNILVNEHGTARIADFGLSRNVDYSKTSRTLFGVVPYIAPERFGRNVGRYTKKCDVYSFGMVLWTISAGGNMPYGSGESHNIMLAFDVMNGLRES